MNYIYFKRVFNTYILSNVQAQMILAFVLIILISSVPLINSALAENIHFSQNPTIKGSIIQRGDVIDLSLIPIFNAIGLENKPTVIYLTISNIVSDKTMCNNLPLKQILSLGPPDKNERKNVQPINGQINFNFNKNSTNNLLSEKNITKSSTKKFCPMTPYIKSATLQNLELHLTQDNGPEILFNFGNKQLNSSFVDSTPNLNSNHLNM